MTALSAGGAELAALLQSALRIDPGRTEGQPSPDVALAVAVRTFLAEERVDMQVLAADVGVGRATLYRWFGDRERLIGLVLSELSRQALQWLADQAPADEKAHILHTIDAFMRVTCAFPPLLRFLNAEPALALRLYWEAVHRDLPVFRLSRDAILRATTADEFCERLRHSDEAARLFRRLVRVVRKVRFKRNSLLTELHDVGLVLAMIPEFKPVVGRVHHDIYHVYTVDAHSIAAVDRMRALCRGELGIARVRVLTNNPDKVAALEACGIRVVARVTHAFPANEHNGRYLRTKAERFGHLF